MINPEKIKNKPMTIKEESEFTFPELNSHSYIFKQL